MKAREAQLDDWTSLKKPANMKPETRHQQTFTQTTLPDKDLMRTLIHPRAEYLHKVRA